MRRSRRLEARKGTAMTREIKAVALVVFVLLTTCVTTQAQTSTDQIAGRLLERIEKLEQALAAAAEREKQLVARLDKLEQPQAGPVSVAPAPSPISDEDRSTLDSLRDTTVNVTLDGYYGYNFNRPIG